MWAHLRFTTPTIISRKDKISPLALHHPETFFHVEGPVGVKKYAPRLLCSLQGGDKDQHKQPVSAEGPVSVERTSHKSMQGWLNYLGVIK